MNQKGFSSLLIVLGIILILSIAGGVYYFGKSQIPKPQPQNFVIGYLNFARPFQVSGNAMSPTYKSGAYLSTSVYRKKQDSLQRGDVIIFKSLQSANVNFIKRIVALPGETVILEDGNLYINGQRLDESKYLNPATKTYGGTFLKDGQTVTVPSGQYFVLSDNRLGTSDSRQWGSVSEENIISKVSFCYWNCK